MRVSGPSAKKRRRKRRALRPLSNKPRVWTCFALRAQRSEKKTMCRPARSPETPARRSRASAAPRGKEAVRELCSGEAARGRRGRRGRGRMADLDDLEDLGGALAADGARVTRDLPPVVKVRARAGPARPGLRRAAPRTSRRRTCAPRTASGTPRATPPRRRSSRGVHRAIATLRDRRPSPAAVWCT